MTYYDQENQFLRQRLQKEIPILTALIQNLYQELDRKFHLNGAKIPVTFGFETDSLGSYTRQSAHEKETSVYKGYKQDKIEMRGDRAEMSDFPLYQNTVAGGLDRRDQTIGGFSFVVKIYAVPVVEIIG